MQLVSKAMDIDLSKGREGTGDETQEAMAAALGNPEGQGSNQRGKGPPKTSE